MRYRDATGKPTSWVNPPTIDEVIMEWYGDRWEHWSPSTVKGTRQIVETYLRPSVGPLMVSDPPWLVVDVFRKAVGHLAPGSIRRIGGVLRSACRWAYRLGLIDTDPSTGLRLPSPQSTVRAASEPQVGALLRRLDTRPHITWRRLRVAVRLAVATGARRGEIGCATWADINGSTWTVRATKTDSTRRVQVDDRTLHLARLLPSDGRIVGLAPQTLSHKLQEASKGEITFTMLRHRAAVRLLESGATINQVAYQLGHSSPTMTLQVYGRVDHCPGALEVLADF